MRWNSNDEKIKTHNNLYQRQEQNTNIQSLSYYTGLSDISFRNTCRKTAKKTMVLLKPIQQGNRPTFQFITAFKRESENIKDSTNYEVHWHTTISKRCSIKHKTFIHLYCLKQFIGHHWFPEKLSNSSSFQTLITYKGKSAFMCIQWDATPESMPCAFHFLPLHHHVPHQH